MIRFFDEEVVCITYDELDRNILRSYFLKGHIDDIVVVLDKQECYVGYINYSSLLHTKNITEAINTNYVILNEDVWKNGRIFFRQSESLFGEIPILPVLNRENQLICFAYEDDEANREIRMLRELEECENALGFEDLYPECECVTIDGFNELAYCFAEYLRRRKISVCVVGELWNEVGEWEKCVVLNYKDYHVYAEGTDYIPEKKKERLWHSVSSEFECIDEIYEANLNENIISDATWEWILLLEKLRQEKEIVICGINREAQDTYDLLWANNIECCCFMTKKGDKKQKIFGKDIICEKEALNCFEHPVFIECSGQCSTWGLGSINNFDYYGFRRNEQMFMIRDYIEVPKSNLLHVAEGKRILLVGDIYLCNRLYRYLQQKTNVQLEYVNLLGEDYYNFKMLEWNESSGIDGTLCFLVLPEYFPDSNGKEACDAITTQYMSMLEKMKIVNYTKYFSDLEVFIELENELNKYTKDELIPKGIIVGSFANWSGNGFCRDVLRSHPDICLINYSLFNNNLYLYCLRLAEVGASDILIHFLRLYEKEAGLERIGIDFPNIAAFEEEMSRLLTIKSSFTSQELFVIFHMAYAYMCGNKVEDINKVVIFWEPHNASRKNHNEKCAYWLRDERIKGYTLKMPRNRYISAGLLIKAQIRNIRRMIDWTKYYFSSEAEKEEYDVLEYDGWNSMIIRFEDLQANLSETYRDICKKLGITWKEEYLRNIHINEELVISEGVDLQTFYNYCEEYLSVVDQMKISLIRRQYQKKYNYPYMNTYDFTRKELQQMFLKNMRYEEKVLESFDLDSQYAYYIDRQRKISEKLWELRQLERMEAKATKRE